MELKVLTPAEEVTLLNKLQLVNFIYEHIGHNKDTREDIKKAIDYALNPYPLAGGFILYYEEKGEVIGVALLNNTGMQGYVPENLLVYLITHKDHRKKGLGRKLLQKAMEMTSGDMALHIEKDHPALAFIKEMGFENPFLEMRLHKEG
ncbi:MAG: GNAT family N-acetyltransferase [Bacteroidales bacterium]